MTLALFLIGIIFNIFIFTLAVRSIRGQAAKPLLLVIAGLTIWEVANYLSNQPNQVVFWNKLTFMGPPIIMLASYYFASSLRSLNRHPILELSLWLGSGVSILLAGVTPFIVAGVRPDVVKGVLIGYRPIHGFLYPVFLIWVLIAVVIFFYAVDTRIENESGRIKQQLKMIRWGTVTAILIPIVTNLILPNVLTVGDSSTFLPLTSMIYVGVLTLAIVRHGLLDVRLAVVRSVAYTLSLIVLALIYYIAAYIVSTTLFSGEVSSQFSVSPLNIVLALLLAFVFQPIKGFFDYATDNIFFRDRYKSDEFYARFSELLTTTTDLHDLLQRAAREISTTLKSEQAFFYVKYNHTHHVAAGTTRHTSLSTQDVKALDEYVTTEGGEIIVTALLPHQKHEMRELLEGRRIALLMPLMRGYTIIGYLALGEQKSSEYTNRDTKVLATISDELVIAIQNALSVQAVRDINASLEKRIKLATAELRTSNAHLRRLDATKDEFISMASHQLRTPLTSVKGYIDMVLEGDVGTITDVQRKLLTQAFDSSERMVHLINDFLNVSRLQTGKFMLEVHPTDLATVVKQEVTALEGTIKSRNLRLTYRSPRHLPELLCDEGKIRQVIMNFIDNAIYYSRPSGVIEIKLYADGSDVVFEVHDDGIGVPKTSQPQLFTKFFRAENARKQRPDGTGIGLFLAQQVIDAHNGHIIFHSQEGQGSVFGFRLSATRLAVEQTSETHA